MVVMMGVVVSVVALAIALSHPVLWGILVADVAGRLASGAIAVRSVQRGGVVLADALRLRDLAPFVRRHWELAVFSLPGALANSAGAMLTPFMIFHVFGAAAAGQYGLVDRAMGVPVAMLVNAGSQVFAGRATQHIRTDNLGAVRQLLIRIVTAGALVCGIGAVIAWLLIPVAFPLVFGARWEPAVGLARIMIFAYTITLVTGIVNQTLVSLGAYRLQSTWDVCWPIFIGMTWFTVVAFKLDLRTAVMLHALAVATLGLIFILLCLVRLRGSVPVSRTRKA